MSINLTNIAWTTYTHNGYSGCVHAGPECAFCYAESFSEQKRGTPSFPHGFSLTWRDNLAELLKVRGPALIFEGSMTDWFQETIPNARIDLLLDTCEQLQQVNPDVRILLLTKRTGRMARYSRRRPFPCGAQPDSAGHLLEGREYVAWPDGRDWRAVKQAIVDRKQAGRARRDGGYHV